MSGEAVALYRVPRTQPKPEIQERLASRVGRLVELELVLPADSQTEDQQAESAIQHPDYSERVGLIGEIVTKFGRDPRVERGLFEANGASRVPIGLGQELTDYLDQIGQYPMLSSDQVREQYKIINNGIDVYSKQGANEQTEEQLIAMLVARQVVYFRNLKLAARVAIDYKKANKPKSMTTIDVIQEANISLWGAVDIFDVSKHRQFSTIAYPRLYRDIDRAVVKHDPIIRLPDREYSVVRKLNPTKANLTRELRREPSTEELAEAIGTTPKKVERAIAHRRQSPTSLNLPVNRYMDEDLELIDTVKDDTDHIDQLINQLSSSEFLKKLCNDENLTTKELFVISLRHGIVIEDLKGKEVDFDGQIIRYNDILENITADEDIIFKDMQKIFGISARRLLKINKDALQKIKTYYLEQEITETTSQEVIEVN